MSKDHDILRMNQLSLSIEVCIIEYYAVLFISGAMMSYEFSLKLLN